MNVNALKDGMKIRVQAPGQVEWSIPGTVEVRTDGVYFIRPGKDPVKISNSWDIEKLA